MWFSSDEYYIGRPPFSSTRRGVAHLCTFPPSGWVFGACTARHRSPRRSWLKPGVERFQAAGRGLPQKVWQVSPQKVWQVKGLADVSPERSGRCLPRKVWRMSPQKGLADVSPEGLAGVRRRGIGSDLPGGIGSDLPGLNAQGELMSARTLSRLFPAPGCGALRWRRQ